MIQSCRRSIVVARFWVRLHNSTVKQQRKQQMDARTSLNRNVSTQNFCICAFSSIVKILHTSLLFYGFVGYCSCCCCCCIADPLRYFSKWKNLYFTFMMLKMLYWYCLFIYIFASSIFRCCCFCWACSIYSPVKCVYRVYLLSFGLQ